MSRMPTTSGRPSELRSRLRALASAGSLLQNQSCLSSESLLLSSTAPPFSAIGRAVLDSVGSDPRGQRITQHSRTEKVQKRASNVMKLTQEHEKLKAELKAMSDRLEAAEKRRQELEKEKARRNARF